MDVSVWTTEIKALPNEPSATGWSRDPAPMALQLSGAGAPPAPHLQTWPPCWLIPGGHNDPEYNRKIPFYILLSLKAIWVVPAWQMPPQHASALLTPALAGWVSSGEPSTSHEHLNLLIPGCGEHGGMHELQGGGDLPMHCCGSADRIRHRWATQSCRNQPGFENVIIGMVNKFTRTLLRQGIAMVTDQKSLGARKVSISGGSGREGEVGALGMLPRCKSLTGVPSCTRASHRTLCTRGHELCPSVPLSAPERPR